MTNLFKILDNLKELKQADDLCITNITPALEIDTGLTIGYNYTCQFFKDNKLIFVVNIFDKYNYESIN